MKLKSVITGAMCISFMLLTASGARAQKWAEDMFEVKEVDMGSVARGADVRYRLNFKNGNKEALNIASVVTGCSCISAKSSTEVLQSLETGHIDIVLDTIKFQGLRETSVTVTFGLPFPATVRIPVKAFIRTDIVLTPGLAEFGSLSKGASAERRIQIAYAGRNDWAITKIMSNSTMLDAEVKETSRGGGRVTYDLAIRTKPGAPVGDLRSQLMLVTNDATNPRIPVLAEGRIDPEFTVSPEVLQYGVMQPGERKTMNIIVRSTSRKPFKVDAVESEKTAGAFETVINKNREVLTHVIPLTFIAPREAMTLSEEFTITIPGSNGAQEHVRFRVFGKVAGSVGAAKVVAQ